MSRASAVCGVDLVPRVVSRHHLPPMTDPLHLGQPSTLPASPEAAVLDYVPNPRPGALYLVRFAAPEFTSLCPVTGQPDFAHLVIDYAPGSRNSLSEAEAGAASRAARETTGARIVQRISSTAWGEALNTL